MHIAVITLATPEPRRGRLHCPICHDPHIVPASLSCTSLLGQPGEMQINEQGLHLDPAAPFHEDDSVINLTFRCGQGHLFALRLCSTPEGTTAESVPLSFSRTALDAERN
jgi:hypothetical protein